SSATSITTTAGTKAGTSTAAGTSAARRHTMKMRILALAAAVALAGGCSKKAGAGGAAGGRPHVDGTPHTDQVVDAWKGAGLSPETFTAIDPVAYRAGYCAQGRVAGVDTIICEYQDDDSLDRAKKASQDERNREVVQTGDPLRTKPRTPA